MATRIGQQIEYSQLKTWTVGGRVTYVDRRKTTFVYDTKGNPRPLHQFVTVPGRVRVDAYTFEGARAIAARRIPEVYSSDGVRIIRAVIDNTHPSTKEELEKKAEGFPIPKVS